VASGSYRGTMLDLLWVNIVLHIEKQIHSFIFRCALASLCVQTFSLTSLLFIYCPSELALWSVHLVYWSIYHSLHCTISLFQRLLSVARWNFCHVHATYTMVCLSVRRSVGRLVCRHLSFLCINRVKNWF
jgi:hypothetical protein